MTVGTHNFSSNIYSPVSANLHKNAEKTWRNKRNRTRPAQFEPLYGTRKQKNMDVRQISEGNRNGQVFLARRGWNFYPLKENL
jgi:hypothetical protein